MENCARICVFSRRRVQREFYRCGNYELEDVLCEVDDVDLLAPSVTRPVGRSGRIANRLARQLSINYLDVGLAPIRLERDYELFFVECEFIEDLRLLRTVRDWKQRCRRSACFVSEFWTQRAASSRSLLRILAEFDHIFCGASAGVPLLRSATGRPTTFVLPGIDALRFCPDDREVQRWIDVYSMGRRRPDLHEALLAMAARSPFFYLFDTFGRDHDWTTNNHAEHRRMLAELLKRTRYFVVNLPKMDKTEETGGQQEIGYRFFEGAAAGTVMIGRAPQTPAFEQHFDWPDAVIPIPEDARDIGQFLGDLDANPARLERARRNGAVNTLRRHDWALRWKDMLDVIGLAPRPQLEARVDSLNARARALDSAPCEA